MLSHEVSPSTKKKLRNLTNKFADIYSEVKFFYNEEKEAIHRYALISIIGASTRIENAILTDNEIDWIDTVLSKDGKTTSFEENKFIIQNKLSKDRERSIEEVAGCRSMLFLIYEQARDMLPLTEAAIRGLHFELMHYYSKAGPDIGRYKTQPNYVAEYNNNNIQGRIVFKTAEAGPITEAAMADLVNWYNQAIVNENYSIAVSCEFVFRFLAIHPFQDGNGRLGRGLFLLSLLHSPDTTISSVSKYLAIDRHIEKHKAEYYSVLNRCSSGVFAHDPKNYKIEYFLLFMIKILEKSLDDVAIYRKKYKSINELSDSANKVLSCFKDHPEIRLNTSLIIESTSLPRRTIINALNALLKEELIQKYGKGSSVKYQLTF